MPCFPTNRIIGLYAARLTVRDIQTHPIDRYGLKISPDLISRVTDALRAKIRGADSWTIKNKAVYIALGVPPRRPARFWA